MLMFGEMSLASASEYTSADSQSKLPNVAAQSGEEARLIVPDRHFLEARVDVAIAAEPNRQALRRNVREIGQSIRIRRAIRERDRAEGIVVVAGRNPDCVEIHHRRLHRLALRAVEPDFAEDAERIGQLVLAGDVEVHALDRRTNRRLVASVVAHLAIYAAERDRAAHQAEIACPTQCRRNRSSPAARGTRRPPSSTPFVPCLITGLPDGTVSCAHGAFDERPSGTVEVS